MSTKSTTKALWAFEPFHHSTSSSKSMYALLKTITGQVNNIHAGFIVTRSEPEISLAFDIPESERFQAYPEKVAVTALKKAGISLPKARLHVVDHKSYSTTKAVDRLLKLAKDEKANLIGLFTHGKKGYERWMVGSFAETAIHRAKCHLLVLKPDSTSSSSLRHLFFATDLTSNDSVSRALHLAKRLGAKATFFHHAEPIWDFSLSEDSPEVRAYRNKTNAKVNKVHDLIKKAKVKGDVVVTGKIASTASCIIEYATALKADLLVVDAKAGPLAALIGGSVTRQVIREAKLPVLILKGKAKI